MGGRTVGKSCKMFEFEVMRAACSASGAPNAGFLETASFFPCQTLKFSALTTV